MKKNKKTTKKGRFFDLTTPTQGLVLIAVFSDTERGDTRPNVRPEFGMILNKLVWEGTNVRFSKTENERIIAIGHVLSL